MAEDNRESLAPDTNASVEDYLARVERRNNESGLDPEMAKKEAIRLAMLEDEIATLLYSYPKNKNPLYDNTFILQSDPEKVEVIRASDNAAIRSHAENIVGEGEKTKAYDYGSVIFVTVDDKKDPQLKLFAQEDVQKKLGVDSRNKLLVYTHTDEKTRVQVDEISKAPVTGSKYRPSGNFDAALGTIYFFDMNGSYGKVVLLPAPIEDDREHFISEGRWKTVKGDMGAGDFELAGYVLTGLKKRLVSAPDPSVTQEPERASYP